MDTTSLEYPEMLKCIKQQKAALLLIFFFFFLMTRVLGDRLLP